MHDDCTPSRAWSPESTWVEVVALQLDWQLVERVASLALPKPPANEKNASDMREVLRQK